MMAKHIVIERPNGVVTIVRSELETPSEEPLTEHEQIINELYSKVKNLGLFSVMRCSFCGDEIKQGEQEYIHKKGFGCCIPEETEKDETHYELFGTTDCDPE